MGFDESDEFTAQFLKHVRVPKREWAISQKLDKLLKKSEPQIRLFDPTLKYYKPAICLPELDDQVWTTPQGQELIAEMKKKNMVTLADLLEGKVEQKGRIDLDEIYYIGAAAGMESQEHGDFPPPSPKTVWVRLSDVTKPLQTVDDKVLWFTSSQLAAKYDKEAQTIRLWFRERFFQKQGYLVERDPTGHCRVGIPSNHAHYREFLKFSDSIKR